jgi:hypothetical protein
MTCQHNYVANVGIPGSKPTYSCQHCGIPAPREIVIDGTLKITGADVVTIGNSETYTKFDTSNVGNSAFFDKIETNQLVSPVPTVPSFSANVDGDIGQFAWDDDYFYIKTYSGWKRILMDGAF